jgi:hypothetical protein
MQKQEHQSSPRSKSFSWVHAVRCCFFLEILFIHHLSCRLYVGSLHFNLTESDIRQVFEPFGELDFVDLHRDPTTGRSKGYAFIQYELLDILRLFFVTKFSDTSEEKMLEWPWSRWKASNWLGGQCVVSSILPFMANTTPFSFA